MILTKKSGVETLVNFNMQRINLSHDSINNPIVITIMRLSTTNSLYKETLMKDMKRGRNKIRSINSQ
ncbi:MAG: hypothetical protein QG670_2547 [Thermoproteota archaeon]|nr:hypothetical protein [Thermoproteota archaeon]